MGQIASPRARGARNDRIGILTLFTKLMNQILIYIKKPAILFMLIR